MKPTTLAAIFIGILIVLLMGAFLFGQWFKQKTIPAPEQKTYNNFVFTKQGDTWTTTWQHDRNTYLLQMRYFPQDIELVPLTGTINTTTWNQKNITITFDPNILENYKYVALAAGELGLSLKRAMGRNPTFTCTTNQTTQDACLEVQPATCNSTTQPVILLNPQGPAEITFNQNCITLSGTDLELLRAADKLLYMWYGIVSR